jgi:hypothetical protein
MSTENQAHRSDTDSNEIMQMRVETASYTSAPKIYSDAQAVMIRPDHVSLLFGLISVIHPADETNTPVVETQAVCTMSKPLFLTFAAMVAEHAATVAKSMEED